MKVFEAAPYWMQQEIRRIMAHRVMCGLSTSKDDELRRCREALEWLDRKVETV